MTTTFSLSAHQETELLNSYQKLLAGLISLHAPFEWSHPQTSWQCPLPPLTPDVAKQLSSSCEAVCDVLHDVFLATSSPRNIETRPPMNRLTFQQIRRDFEDHLEYLTLYLTLPAPTALSNFLLLYLPDETRYPLPHPRTAWLDAPKDGKSMLRLVDATGQVQAFPLFAVDSVPEMLLDECFEVFTTLRNGGFKFDAQTYDWQVVLGISTQYIIVEQDCPKLYHFPISLDDLIGQWLFDLGCHWHDWVNWDEFLPHYRLEDRQKLAAHLTQKRLRLQKTWERPFEDVEINEAVETLLGSSYH